ncbi:MAG: polymerase subunit delta [Firmicutes bacterium]|nr:polymerase subunit delta [Bacillota bacterium]
MIFFDSIIGHDNIKLQIVNSMKSDRFHHAHIIVGEDGIGKSNMAKAIALKILGKEKDMPYPDIVYFRLEGSKKSIGVEEVRSIIAETNKKPFEGDKKVMIIHEMDKMTEAAQNTLLKTIEEPPQGVYILILCENIESVLDTIKSRCEIYKLNRLGKEEMKSFLDARYPGMSGEEKEAIAAFSDGIPGRSEKYKEDPSFVEIRDTALEILLSLKDKKPDELLKYGDFLMKYKNQWDEVFTWFLSYIRDAVLYKETGETYGIINADKINSIKHLSEMFSFNSLSDIIEVVKESRKKLERNVNTALVFDSLLINMQEV